MVEGGGIERIRVQLAREMVDYIIQSGERLATPDDPLAKLRREVLRGLRQPPGERRNGFP